MEQIHAEFIPYLEFQKLLCSEVGNSFECWRLRLTLRLGQLQPRRWPGERGNGAELYAQSSRA